MEISEVHATKIKVKLVLILKSKGLKHLERDTDNIGAHHGCHVLRRLFTAHVSQNLSYKIIYVQSSTPLFSIGNKIQYRPDELNESIESTIFNILGPCNGMLFLKSAYKVSTVSSTVIGHPSTMFKATIVTTAKQKSLTILRASFEVGWLLDKPSYDKIRFDSFDYELISFSVYAFGR